MARHRRKRSRADDEDGALQLLDVMARLYEENRRHCAAVIIQRAVRHSPVLLEGFVLV